MNCDARKEDMAVWGVYDPLLVVSECLSVHEIRTTYA